MLCSPRHHRMASTTLLFPLPFGPTKPVIPGVNSKRVARAKLLNPDISSDLRNRATSPGKTEHCRVAVHFTRLKLRSFHIPDVVVFDRLARSTSLQECADLGRRPTTN